MSVANGGSGESSTPNGVVKGESDQKSGGGKGSLAVELSSSKAQLAVPEKPQDDWQVAYVWAFLVKFGLRDKIKGLEGPEDLERCLTQPVALRPDDVLEGILIRFLANLKPGIKQLRDDNIQSQLSSYISDQLRDSNEFTVWDDPWPQHEDQRGACCSTAPDRLEQGRLRQLGEDPRARVERNPIKQMEKKGQGIFELDWQERAKLLRQLVDWQLTHAESIRQTIKEQHSMSKKAYDELKNPIKLEPLGTDRKKVRIWSLDGEFAVFGLWLTSDSPRLYRSGNPFKRPCPLVPYTFTRDELQAEQERFAAYGAEKAPKLVGSGPKGKPTKTELRDHNKLVKGIQDEAKLAEKLAEIVPNVEKEEARVQRVRKKILQEQQNRLLFEARERPTRSRRTTQKVDYTYDGFESDDYDEPRRGGRRGRGAADSESENRRPVIPGEQRSARVSARQAMEDEEYEEQPTRSPTPPPSPPKESKPTTREVFPEGVKKVKGYAWVEDVDDKESEMSSQPNGDENADSGVDGSKDEPIEID